MINPSENPLMYPRGTLLCFYSGDEYEDNWTVCGHIIALVDLDLRALAQEFSDSERRRNKENNKTFRSGDGNRVMRFFQQEDRTEFAAWLVARGVALSVKTEVVYLGGPGDGWRAVFGVDNRWQSAE